MRDWAVEAMLGLSQAFSYPIDGTLASLSKIELRFNTFPSSVKKCFSFKQLYMKIFHTFATCAEDLVFVPPSFPLLPLPCTSKTKLS